MPKHDSINMKKTLFVLPLFLFLLSSLSTQAQYMEQVVRRNVIKTNPLAMLQGPIIGFAEYRIMYERTLTPAHALQASLGYLGKGIVNSDFYMDFMFANPISEVDHNGYRVTAAYKFYTDNYAPNGWYLMPHASFSYGKMHSKSDPDTDYITATYINVTGNFGYQVLVDDRFAADFYFGLGWKSNTWSGYGQYHNDPGLPVQNVPVKVNIGMNFGIAF